MQKLIYIADDEQNIRMMMKTFLENEGYAVEVFGDGYSIRKAVREKMPDMIILDVMMPGEDGLSLCTSFRKESRVPIMIVSAKDSPMDRVTGITMGSDDYISKPFSIDILRRKVSAILKRTITENARVQYKDLEVDMEKCLVLLHGEEVHLSATEYKLLCYLIQHKGTVVTKAMLLENLWDKDGNFIDDNTLRVNIKRLRQKLRDDNQEYIVTVFGIGYTFGE